MHRIPRQSYDRSDRKSRYRDRFLGERGKERRKEWLKSEKPWRVTDEEIALMRTRYDQIDPAKIEEFKDFPLSKSTLEGLKHARYTVPTDIQRQSIGLALQGHDILAAAKTGSGKTLAFMIPVLEKLYCLKWSVLDGLGALIISPTRELAYQIFHVMRKIGQAHDFSAGLVIGGKNLKEESELIHKTNIVICTPGRLLQHMDENPTFTADTLQILILDEADRILDLGFEKTMNAIIENFPVTRQTLLFSATQTKSVKDLARLSLKQSLYYVSAHEHAQHSTPLQLTQSYIVCELHDKLTILMSFIKNHLKSKILVFLSTCKQVRYVYQAFCRAQPGVTLLALYGIMKQLKRVEMYNLFWRKQHAVLFATDVAARGLDFPAVHWVIQFDCPDDANTYIHRAGRTARYESNGESLLFLMPSEEAEMLTQLKEKKIPIEKIQVNEKKLQNVQPKLEAQCVADPSLKENAKKAFVSYLRSVVLMSNKKIFDAQKLDTDKFARSLGLAICPRVRFLEREKLRLEEKQKQSLSSSRYDLSGTTAQKSSKSANSEVGTEIDSSKGDNQNESGNDSESEALSGSGRQCLKEKLKSKNQFDFSIDDVGDNLLTVKRVDTVESEGEQNEQCNVKYLSKNSRKKKSKYAMAKQALKKRITLNTKVDFDDNGNPIKDLRRTAHIQVRADDNYQGGICIKAARKFLEEEDKFDKQLFREQIKKKHKEKYQKMKQKRKEQKSKKQQSSEDEGVTAFVDPSTQDPLSYLPDPDEIYGKSGDEKEREDDSHHKNSDSDDEQHSYYEHPVKRRKTEHVLLSSGEDGDDFEAVMSLRDEEELALQLLKSS